ncbi:hypothetical protein THAOC_28999, partial [Thalassiosira oceanica]
LAAPIFKHVWRMARPALWARNCTGLKIWYTQKIIKIHKTEFAVLNPLYSSVRPGFSSCHPAMLSLFVHILSALPITRNTAQNQS